MVVSIIRNIPICTLPLVCNSYDYSVFSVKPEIINKNTSNKDRYQTYSETESTGFKEALYMRVKEKRSQGSFSDFWLL